MDFIFGSNQEEPPKPKPKEKELKESFTIKDEATKPKELTPLQKLKLEQKRKLMLEKIENQFDDMYGDESEGKSNKMETKQLQQQKSIDQNGQQMQPVTHLNQQNGMKNINQYPIQQKNSPPTPIISKKPINYSQSPKPVKKQQNQLKISSPPKISKQLNTPNKSNPKNQPTPKIPSKDAKLTKETPKVTSKLNDNLKNSSVKQISKDKGLNSPKKLISSDKQISPNKQLKPIKEIKSNEPKPTNPIKPNKQIKTIQPSSKPQQKVSRFGSKQQPPIKSSLSITQAQQSIQQSIRQLRQSSNRQKSSYDPQYNFNSDMIDPQSHLNINSLLEGELAKSQRGMRFLDKKLIGDSLSDADNLVYNALTSRKPQEYLKGVYHNIYPDNEFIKSEVDDAVNGAIQNINKLIVEEPTSNRQLRVNVQKRIAPKHKDDLKHLEKLDKYRLLKIKQGEVKHKVGDLRHELEKEYFANKNLITINTSDLVDVDYYAMDHPQTIKAQNMIKQLKQRRRSQHRQYKQILTQKQLQQQKIKQLEKSYEQMYNQQRRQKLQQYYEQKHLEREKQKQELRQKQQQWKEWIKMYEREKPLEEKLQEEMVMKFIVPEIEERHKKLMQIKAQHRPIDVQEINQHQQRYLDYKRDQRIRLKAQLQNKTEDDHANQQQVNRYYKGKYRYLVLESMYEEKNMTDPKDIERSKKQRQLAYSDQVKYVHKSLIKRKQDREEDTRALIRRVRGKDGGVGLNGDRLNRTLEVGGITQKHVKRDAETIDTYAEGIRNLQYAKSHVREKLMNGEEKKPKIEFIQQKVRHQDYLSELRQQRQHSSLPPNTQRSTSLKNISIFLQNKSKTIVNDLSTANDVESLKAKVDNLDERLKRKEVKYRNVRDQHLVDGRIEEEYVEAINAKLKLVQELK